MDENLEKIIKTSTFEVIPGNYVYTRVNTAPPINGHFLITQDNDEVTVITKKENLKDLDLIERNQNNWTLVSLNLSAPFTKGFLAIVTKAVSEAETNTLIISTYSKDYLIVKSEFLDQAKQALIKLGFKEK